MTKIYYQLYSSPITPIHLYADDEHLLAIAFDANKDALVKKLGLEKSSEEPSPILEQTKRQLGEYFRGERKDFDLPLKLQGTEFQRQAWEALKKIPYGQSMSYTDQALGMNKGSAVRAVGAANGKNAYSIIIPCHRVIGRSGSLTGYAGGKGVKAALLKLEGFDL